MALGATLRALLGPHERAVANLYRSIFVDLDDYKAKIRAWVPRAASILEIGCGEGAVTELLADIYADARITAIDITPRVGRLYQGRKNGVEFLNATIQEIAESHPAAFDLVLISDVVHHIPHELRGEVLRAAGSAIAPGGHLIFKDWAKSASPIHWLCYASDRWITGDRIAYLTRAEAERIISQEIVGLRLQTEAHVAPWRNNIATVYAA
jgi:2-polyprenyl-3-methyl-5-hydroxy-6-metoxy-1,4-benzoquinol methylase